MSHDLMDLNLKVWRQAHSKAEGYFENILAQNISPHMSFLEMLDIVNENLLLQGADPIAFDHDCREGICGMCSLVINGKAHGPQNSTTTCQLHMRQFKNGDSIMIEPFRAKAFPIVRDLIVDRKAFDRIIQAGGFVSVNTGSAPDGNALLVPKNNAELAMDAASCIGCGACVAQCKNASAMLFVSAKVSQLGLLPQGQPERYTRVQAMVAQMDTEQFGSCTNQFECEAVCPKDIKATFISQMNRDYLVAKIITE